MPRHSLPVNAKGFRAAGGTDGSATPGVVRAIRDLVVVPAGVALEVERHTVSNMLQSDEPRVAASNRGHGFGIQNLERKLALRTGETSNITS